MPWDLTPEEKAASDLRWSLARKLCWEYDPKTDSSYYTRSWFLDLTKFDLDEQTQYGPMRFTDSVISDDHTLSDSLNVLCLKIISSDVGYPINVYGTVIVRDRVDFKCINIFRRDKFNCQLIQSENEDLILTGTSRGIEAYFEIDLKIKEEHGCNDRQFSKGLLNVSIIKIKSKVESETLVSWLSEVQLVVSYVKKALEGTTEIKIMSGPAEVFHGKITACTTDVANHLLLLYDSSISGAIAVSDVDSDLIQLLRRVVAVSEDESLVFSFAAYIPGADSQNISCACTEFSPRINGSDEGEITCGPNYKMQVKVVNLVCAMIDQGVS